MPHINNDYDATNFNSNDHDHNSSSDYREDHDHNSGTGTDYDYNHSDETTCASSHGLRSDKWRCWAGLQRSLCP